MFLQKFTVLVHFALSGNVSFDTECNRNAGRIPFKDASVRRINLQMHLRTEASLKGIRPAFRLNSVLKIKFSDDAK